MAVETDQDRLAFFDTDDFAFVATISVDGQPDLTVPGNYDAPAVTRGLKQNNQFSYNQGQDVAGDKPTFDCRASDIPGVRNGRATIALRDDQGALVGNFTAYDVKHDGTGMACIVMMKA